MLSSKFLRFRATSPLSVAETKPTVKASRPIESQPNLNDRPEQAKPDQSGQEAPQMQAGGGSATAPPGQRATPGRRPLFRS
jgi:hypothetical protein